MSGLTLDSGGLIAIERGASIIAWLAERGGRRASRALAVPTGVLAQVWRGGRGQARLARFLRLPEVELVGLTGPEARLVGQMLAASGTSDVVDAWVVLCARRRHHAIVTSDPDDLRRLDPSCRLAVL